MTTTSFSHAHEAKNNNRHRQWLTRGTNREEKDSFSLHFSRMNCEVVVVVVLLFVSTSTSFDFHRFVRSVASRFHSNWREHFLLEHPHVKNRFKLTSNGHRYNRSDFIYPMILTVGPTLVHRNWRVAQHRSNLSLIYVDILNLNYDELPSDWAKENRDTARVACRELLRAVKRRKTFTRQLIEQISEKIHVKWIERNRHRTRQDELLLPFHHLPEQEKDKDRRAILIACRLFNELHFYRTFLPVPIVLCQ